MLLRNVVRVVSVISARLTALIVVAFAGALASRVLLAIVAFEAGESAAMPTVEFDFEVA